MLQETTRPYDTCIRYGGDEFVVLLSSCGGAEADERRRQLQAAVAAYFAATQKMGARIALRVSAGASVFPEDGDTYERLLARADRRMYRNKAASKTARSLPAHGQPGQRRSSATSCRAVRQGCRGTDSRSLLQSRRRRQRNLT